MKLAEALILRADYMTRISQLRQRLSNNAKVQEGEQPAEDPQALLKEFERVADGLMDLIKRINKTNTITAFDPQKTLTDALAERDVLATRRKVYDELVNAASATQDRYSRSEIKFKSTVDIKTLQKKVDDLAKAYRELDTKIQSLNWTVELLD
ncbi:DIP1984 family protein [Alkanindiges sp. WGS2144]|uniref:DIP1984 family protein n=1 Tax=Alkanindiges sp. WGS2144 TaxID=3366808 RepID=UPI0037508B81